MLLASRQLFWEESTRRSRWGLLATRQGHMGRSVGGWVLWFVWNTVSYLIDFVMPIRIRITLHCCADPCAYVRLRWREAVCRIGWERRGQSNETHSLRHIACCQLGTGGLAMTGGGGKKNQTHQRDAWGAGAGCRGDWAGAVRCRGTIVAGAARICRSAPARSRGCEAGWFLA